MKLGQILLKLEFCEIKRWFKTQTVSKLLVIAGFGGVLSFVVAVIYALSQAYFRELLPAQEFGFLTTRYLFHAALIILAWFAWGSSLISAVTILTRPSKYLCHLVTFPIDIGQLAQWSFGKTLVTSLGLLALVLTPMAAAYTQTFTIEAPLFLLRFFLVILLTTVITAAAGTLLAYKIVFVTRRIGWGGILLGLGVLVALSIILVRLVLPPTLSQLTQSPPEMFLSLYEKLPLNQTLLPSGWLIDFLFTGFNLRFIYLTLGTLILLIFTLKYIFQNYYQLWLRLAGLPHHLKLTSTLTSFGKTALLKKDLLLLFRSPEEMGYAVFLTAMGLFFFIFFLASPLVQVAESGYIYHVVIFSFVWLGFFTTAFLLRLVFPLMTREGKTAWFIFTLPLKKDTLLYAKLKIGFILVTPFLLLGVGIWRFFPFPLNNLPLTLFSLLTIISLTLGAGLLGSISPDFRQASDPEKVSTSAMGLITLAFSVGAIAVMTLTLSRILTNSDVRGELYLFGLGLPFTFLLLFALARRSLDRFEF